MGKKRLRTADQTECILFNPKYFSTELVILQYTFPDEHPSPITQNLGILVCIFH